ncbi:MAG: prevent-host-death protein [Cyanobacteria bacterium J06639_14]
MSENVNTSQVQYISDTQGEVTGVIIPVHLWRDILSELETQHLLKSDVMRQYLLEANNRCEGIVFETAIAQLELE